MRFSEVRFHLSHYAIFRAYSENIMAVQVNYYGDKHSFESSILFTSKAIPGREDHVSDILVTSETGHIPFGCYIGIQRVTIQLD